MADLETLLTYLTLISVPIGVFYHIMTLNNTRKNQEMQLEARRTQTFLQHYGATTQDNIRRTLIILSWEWSDLEDFDNKYWKDIENRSLAVSVWERFNGLGLLAEENQVDIILVQKLSGAIIKAMWTKCEGVIMYRREVLGDPNRYGGFEYLYYEIQRIEELSKP